MFKINTLTVKNFMSIGNQTQAIDFNRDDLTLVLGENLDMGGDDSGARNGTGKTTIINALSYGLFGQALTKIKQNNLINKTNGKNMLVTVEFEKDGVRYRIERGRKPMLLQYFIDDHEQEIDDFAQGDSRKTQEDIQKLLQMSHDMFKHIMALNTYTLPFLSMPVSGQRVIIEQLLGITLLSEKADALREEIKTIKDDIKEENFKIEAQIQANKRIEETIISLKRKQSSWNTTHTSNIKDLQDGLDALSHVDIKAELEAHTALNAWNKLNDDHAILEKEYKHAERTEARCLAALETANKNLEKAKENKCPECDQELHDNSLLERLSKTQLTLEVEYAESVVHLNDIVDQMEEGFDPGDKPEVFYNSEHDAREHQTTLKHLQEQLTAKQAETDPYEDQIHELQNEAIQEVNYDDMNALIRIKDHQDFLLKLLVNKDSYVRKKIIDQNLSFLNNRLDYYLDKIGLPHTVEFQNDLSVDITEYGRDLDFDNLSRGERNRLILGLSWAFRDVWENLYQPVNLLFIDELIDSGMDSIGVENSIRILKKISRERKKSVWLVSHKDDLASRVNNVLVVTKENGFTSYANDVDIV